MVSGGRTGSLHRPSHTGLAQSIGSFSADRDVNRSLASLLLTPAEAAAMFLSVVGEEEEEEEGEVSPKDAVHAAVNERGKRRRRWPKPAHNARHAAAVEVHFQGAAAAT